MTEKKPIPKLYMNVNSRAVYYAKPQHADNPKMIPFFGECPPIDKDTGLCTVPREELGPEFAAEAGDVTTTTETKKAEPVKLPVDIEQVAAAIGDLKKFDFTSAGIPKVDKLSLAVGYPVSGKERDDAFAMYLEMQEIIEE